MDNRSLVELALTTRRAQATAQDGISPHTTYEKEDDLSYALGWLVASSLVCTRFADSGIDVLPIQHPDRGWDRFVLTRRVTSRTFADESADRFGLILLRESGSPLFTNPSGTSTLALGAGLLSDVEATLAGVNEQIPIQPVTISPDDRAWQQRLRVYPRLYRAVTELIAEHPGMMAAREIFIDTDSINGAYHPLYLHAISSEPQFTYDWFLIEHGDYSAFLRTHGGRAIYRTDRGGWSTVKLPLTEHSLEEIKGRIRAWLRISGTPDPMID